MSKYMQMGGVKAIGAVAVLGLGLLCAPSAARADYLYTFTLTPLSGTGANASGTFALDSIPSTSPGTFALFTSVDAILYTNGSNYAINQTIRGGNVKTTSLGYSLSALFLGPGSSLSFAGIPTVTNDEIAGSVVTIYSANSDFVDEASFFDALLSSDGSSGGAPAPEVNAALSLAIAGATVAFLRRKRGGRSGSAAD
jgi:hypothetical protein